MVQRSYAQTPAQYVRKGDSASEKGKWEEAFSYYEQAFEIDTPSFELTKKYATAARHIKYYQLAEELYDKNYLKDNGKLDPDGLYWLAVMQKYNGKYEDAQRNFKKYLKKHKATGSKQLVQRAEQDAKSALWAFNHKGDISGPDSVFNADFHLGCKSEYVTVLLPKTINSDQSEIAPLVQNNKFFYSSYVDHVWRIKDADLVASEEDSAISNAPLPRFENIEVIKGVDEIKTGNANFSLLGDVVFFSRQEGEFTRIMTGVYRNNEVTEVRPLDVINAEGTMNTMPFACEYGGKKHLFFVSNREGGHGGLDIWFSVDEGGWSKPQNAGKRVNTEGDEITPFHDQDELYFSSDWHEGFGGMDVFYAHRKGESFSSPVNAGTACNSSYNDIGFSIAKDKNTSLKRMFFSSNRPDTLSDGNFCCNDLYLATGKMKCASKQNDLVGTTIHSLMEELPVVLYFHNDEPNPDSWDTTSTLSYNDAYNSYLKLIPVYQRENTRGLTGEKREDAETMTNDFFELKVKKGMNDLELFSDLLLKELEKGKSIMVSVRGFASPRAQSDYNLNLTKRRTASLVNFLSVDSGSVFLPYIEDRSANGARLEFELLPFGEVKADASVSDDLVDEKNSIYNRSACLERKIEIEKVTYIGNTPKRFEFKMREQDYDFGIIPKLGAVQHDFEIANDGNTSMQIDSVVAECGCTEPHLDKSLLLPGEKTALHIGFNPMTRQGKDVKHVFIYIHGEEPKILTICAERSK